MERSIFDIQADFCKAMGNAIRLQVLYTLRERSMIVNEIVAQTGFSQSIVSRQLSALCPAGVVDCQRHGIEMFYQLSDSQVGEVCDLVRKALSEQMKKRLNMFAPDQQ